MAALAIVQPSSLAARLQEVEAIASTLAALDDADGLSHEEYAALQEALILSIAGTREKIDRTVAVFAAFDGAIAAADAELVRLKARKARFEGQRERLQTYVLCVLETSNLNKLDGHTSTLTRRLNPAAVWIGDVALVPDDYMRTPPPPAPVPDKKAIAEALKLGVAVDGCELRKSARLVIS